MPITEPDSTPAHSRIDKQKPSFESLFQAATGVSVSTFTYLGHCKESPPVEAMPQVCQHARSTPDGCQRCEAFHQELLSAAKDKTVTRVCPAGLTETAIPIKSERATLGFLLAGQILVGDCSTKLDEARALGEEVNDVIAKTQSLSSERYQAVISLLEMEAEKRARASEGQTAATSEKDDAPTETPLPPPIAAAIRFIHANLDQSLSLNDVAYHASLSAEHFSRKFKESTCITYLQYLNEARVLHARNKLVETR